MVVVVPEHQIGIDGLSEQNHSVNPSYTSIMSDGWIKLYRQLTDNDIWLSEKFTDGQAWVDLLLLANHTKGFIKVRGIRLDLQPGQCGYSVLTLAKRWRWSRGKVLRFIDFLDRKNMVKTVQQKNHISTIISIVNYSNFQFIGTTNSTTDVQQTDTNKNEKNEKNNIPVIFDEFRKQFPGIKRGLKTELENFLKKNNPETIHLLMPALEKEKSHKSKLKSFGQLVPDWKNLATWINQKCWEQEFPDLKKPLNGKQQFPQNEIQSTERKYNAI